MKKAISLLLAFVLLVGLFPVSALAADNPQIVLSVDKTNIEAGSDVTVTIALDKDIAAMGFGECFVYYDSALFARKSYTDGTALPGTAVSKKSLDAKNEQIPTMQKISISTANLTDVDATAGEVATITFTALETITEVTETQMYVLVDFYCNNAWEYYTVGNNEPVKLTVGPVVPVNYTVEYVANSTANGKLNSNMPVRPRITSDKDVTVDTLEMTLSYDPAVLKYNLFQGSMTAAEENGTVTLSGADMNMVLTANTGKVLGSAIFTAIGLGDATVTMTSMKVNGAEILEAPVLFESCIGYQVTLPQGEGYTVNGAAYADKDGAYTFSVVPAEGYADYGMTVKANGEELTANEDGSYTVAKVTSELEITVEMTEPVASVNYTVSFAGNSGVNVRLDSPVPCRPQIVSDQDVTVDTLEMTLTYNPEVLTFTVFQGPLTAVAENGVVTLSGTGLNMALTAGTAKVPGLVGFTTIGLGDATVTMTSMKINGAEVLAAPMSFVSTCGYKVTLPQGEGYTVNGTAYAEVNGAYTFSVVPTEGYADYGVTVKANGEELTANADGSYTIAKVTSAPEITVEMTAPVAVSGITLDKTWLTLDAGDDATLVATVLPENAADKTVTWSSADASVVTVDQNGNIHAVRAGQTNIIAKAGEFTATCTVEVLAKVVPVESITLDVTTLELKVGEEYTLTATILPSNHTNPNVIWTSDNMPAVIIRNGWVKGIGVGEATVTVSCDGVSASCKVIVTEEKTPGYTVTMDADKSIVAGETVTVSPVIGHGGEVASYNAFDMTFAYDASVLELTSTEIEGLTVTAGNGTVRVQGYGADRAIGTAPFGLTFKAIAAGEAQVTLSSAKVDIAANAVEFDAPEAELLDEKTVITVTSYPVTLPDNFTGEALAQPGEAYTFSEPSDYYDYTVTVTVDGVAIEVTDNGDGTYTVPADKVTGIIEVTATKEGKKFDVTPGTDMAGNPKAQYMTDYTMTLTKEEGYTYDVVVTIGGVPYTGYTVSEGVYTIPGADITGDIVFTVVKEEIPKAEFTVTFEGSGAGDATGAATVLEGSDYTFTLNQAAGYTYAVTAVMGENKQEAAITEADGKYTIEKVSGNLIITVEKTAQRNVEVSPYVELDGKTVFLVTATGTLEEGKAFAYDGNAMFYSEQYKAWCYLVIAEGEFGAADAKAKITATETAYATLSATADVNMSKAVDINDAQLVYDIYNGKYEDFSVVVMQKFLNADVNGDKIVNVADAAAVVAAIQ